MLSLRERLAIANKNVDAAKRILEITKAKVTNGVSSNLDLAQQTAIVAGEEAQFRPWKNRNAKRFMRWRSCSATCRKAST